MSNYKDLSSEELKRTLAEKQDMFDKFDSDLALVKETINTNKDLKDFLEHPLIQSNDKKDAIDSIFREHISNYTLNLINLQLLKLIQT